MVRDKSKDRTSFRPVSWRKVLLQRLKMGKGIWRAGKDGKPGLNSPGFRHRWAQQGRGLGTD